MSKINQKNKEEDTELVQVWPNNMKTYSRKHHKARYQPPLIIYLPIPKSSTKDIDVQENQCAKEKAMLRDTGVQVNDERTSELKMKEMEILHLKQNIEHFKSLPPADQQVQWMMDDADRFYYYVGFTLQEYEVFWNFLGEAKNSLDIWGSGHEVMRPKKIQPREQFMLTLLRFRQNYTLTDLAYRFHISVSYASQIFSTWVQFLYCKLSEFRDDFYVDREHHKPLPRAFRNAFLRDTRIVLDCTEILCESSTNFKQQGNLFSSYKHHTTLKILIGVAPSGACMFVSDCYEGNISDKSIVVKSEVLEKLNPGDVVLADRGFTIAELCRKKEARLVIPPFVKGRKALSPQEVAETKIVAAARIHIERFNERLKNFRIIQGVVELSLCPLISQIVYILCFFVNFQEPLAK